MLNRLQYFYHKMRLFLLQQPFLGKQQPKEQYTSVQELVAKAKTVRYTEVFPARHSSQQANKVFYERCIRYNHQEAITVEANLAVSYVLQLPKTRVVFNSNKQVAIMTADNKLITELSFLNHQEEQKNISALHFIFSKQYFSIPTTVKSTAFIFFTYGKNPNDWFDWLFDILPQVFLIKKTDLFSQIDYFIMPNELTVHQEQALELLQIPADKIMIPQDYADIQFNKLVTPVSVRIKGHTPDWVCEYLRKSFLRIDKVVTKSFSPCVYLLNPTTNSYQIQNEAALIINLKKYGFFPYSLDKLSLEEQTILFAKAKIIVSMRSESMANIVFCTAGTHVIEIQHEDALSPEYLCIAQQVNLIHHLFECRRLDERRMTEEEKIMYKNQIEIDIVVLDRVIENIFRKQWK